MRKKSNSLRLLAKTLCDVVRMRDPVTGDHMNRTGRYAQLLAEAYLEKYGEQENVPEGFPEILGVAASLHDLGKIAIPEHILMKPAPLTEGEQSVMRNHARLGSYVFNRMQDTDVESFSALTSEVCTSHHERWNGEGYPDGLKGEEIPLSARIVALADYYDALAMHRVYRPTKTPHEQITEMIKDQRGIAFAPQVVDAYLACEEAFLALRHELEAERAEDEAYFMSTLNEVGNQRSLFRLDQPVTVLVVDDSEITCEFLEEFLKLEGMTPQLVTSIQEARDVLEKQIFDLVLVDLGLPDGPGEVLLDELKGMAPRTISIVISGQRDISTAVETFQHGAYGYLTKPFTLAQAKQTLRRAIQRRQEELYQKICEDHLRYILGDEQKATSAS